MNKVTEIVTDADAEHWVGTVTIHNRIYIAPKEWDKDTFKVIGIIADRLNAENISYENLENYLIVHLK